MEATHLTRRQRRHLSVFVLCVVLALLGTLSAAAWALREPVMFFASLTTLALGVPLMALAIGWPILLMLGCKTAIDLLGRWRQAAPPRVIDSIRAKLR